MLVNIMDKKSMCYICNKTSEKRIILLDKCICKKCEQDLLEALVGGPTYEKIKEGIKDIWKNFDREHTNKDLLI